MIEKDRYRYTFNMKLSQVGLPFLKDIFFIKFNTATHDSSSICIYPRSNAIIDIEEKIKKKYDIII